MTRRIVLELAGNSTATHCGDCRLLALKNRCVIWGYNPHLRDENGFPPRHPDCIAAERIASRLLDVSPEDARFVSSVNARVSYEAFAACDRIEASIKDHAKKAEVKP